MLSRRELLKLSMAAGTTAAISARLSLTPAGAAPFSVELPIPPVLKPVRRTDERDVYEIVMRQATKEIVPGKRTRIWGFNGRFPGPTISVERGRQIVVRQINRLDVPVTIHLHGGRVTPNNDGHPMDLIAPGDRKSYRYRNRQRSSTLWYHDHTHGSSSRNVYMGLAGLYIIRDNFERSLNLPRGRFDIPLIIQDRAFTRSGQFRFESLHGAFSGGTYLVNGRPTPRLRVAKRKYRFRILNASNQREYSLGLDSGLPLVQIASDGGLLPSPYTAPLLPISPAERIEVVIDFSMYPNGTNIVLVDRAATVQGKPIMRFDVVREADDDSDLPSALRPITPLTPGGVERDFELNIDNRNRWVINGKLFEHDRIDARPKIGATEVWTFRNVSSVVHPMHIHLVMFQILDRNGAPPPPGEAGWKDTVRVDPGETVRVVAQFRPGGEGRYVFHCHNLVHEDHSMMGQFKLVR